MNRTILLLSAIALLLTSCAKKIDGTTEESLKASIKEINKSLDNEKRKKFEESMMLIMVHGLDFEKLIEDGGAKETFPDLKTKLDGKTADEIIAEGDKIKAEIEQKKKEQAKGEIGELYQKQEQAEK